FVDPHPIEMMVGPRVGAGERLEAAVLERGLQLRRHREDDAAVGRAIAAAREGQRLAANVVDAGAGGDREVLRRKHLQLAPPAGPRVEAQAAAKGVDVVAGERLAGDAEIAAARREIDGGRPAAIESTRAAFPTQVTGHAGVEAIERAGVAARERHARLDTGP